MSDSSITCEVLRQYATAAHASSWYNNAYDAREAVGPPTFSSFCAVNLGYSWAPLYRDSLENQLTLSFDTPIFPSHVRVWEHANPPAVSGFITRIEVASEAPHVNDGNRDYCRSAHSGTCDEPYPCIAGTDCTDCNNCEVKRNYAWETVWTGNDETPCGSTFVATIGTGADGWRTSQPVRQVRLTTKTRGRGWEYIDAVQLEGTACLPPTAPPTPPLLPGTPSPDPPPPAVPGLSPLPAPPLPISFNTWRHQQPFSFMLVAMMLGAVMLASSMVLIKCHRLRRGRAAMRRATLRASQSPRTVHGVSAGPLTDQQEALRLSVHQLPTFEYCTPTEGDGSATQDECTVCLCDFVPGELVKQLPCSHIFHQTCIDRWLVDTVINSGTHALPSCPLCKRVPLSFVQAAPGQTFADILTIDARISETRGGGGGGGAARPAPSSIELVSGGPMGGAALVSASAVLASIEAATASLEAVAGALAEADAGAATGSVQVIVGGDGDGYTDAGGVAGADAGAGSSESGADASSQQAAEGDSSGS